MTFKKIIAVWCGVLAIGAVAVAGLPKSLPLTETEQLIAKLNDFDNRLRSACPYTNDPSPQSCDERSEKIKSMATKLHEAESDQTEYGIKLRQLISKFVVGFEPTVRKLEDDVRVYKGQILANKEAAKRVVAAPTTTTQPPMTHFQSVPVFELDSAVESIKKACALKWGMDFTHAGLLPPYSNGSFGKITAC